MCMEASPLDLRILRNVLENGLLESERQIAGRLRISPSTFSFKMRRFEDRGIITAYRYRVDYRKIGLANMAWARMRPKYGKRTMDEYMASILENPNAHVCVFTSGSKNLAVKIYAGSREQAASAAWEIARGAGVERRDIEIFHANRQIKAHNQALSQSPEMQKLSPQDIRILSEKMQNPQQSLVGVAKRLGLHRNTVTSRWNAMLRGKIVIKKTPIISPELHRQIGIHCMGMHIFTPKKGAGSRLAGILAGMNEVHELSETAGGELLAIIRTNDLSTYYTLTSRFLSDKKIAGCIGKSLFNTIIASDSRRPTYLKDLKMRSDE